MPLRQKVAAIARRLRLERPARASLRLAGAARRRARAAGTATAAAGSGVAAGAQWLADAPRRRRLARGYASLLASRVGFDELLGRPSPDSVAIVVCLWNRPDRIDDVLRIIDAQQAERPLRLVLWNNQPADDSRYRAAIEGYTASGALASVEYFTSPTNIGGMARFVAARELLRRGYSGPFIMLDDDENVGRGFVADLLAAYTPRSISGLWAWTNDGAYWNRTQLVSTGDRADHVGTGGSIVDSALVDDDRFFTAIPQQFLFMEDMWMSHYGTRNGWPLQMVATPVEFVLSELDQGHAIFDRKEQFFSWLQHPEHVPLRHD
ncbi:hypothetical protein FB562_1754 [Homoserinimonas aerilata]|uniref:Glycosyl transferase family 2 n=1 Tax=Homoserinimonas aerilata TaxID=1162970 RepID=A0A542YKN5_9MICO|nr:hypothetical protein [Homoserinimonas aerilata]TQL48656.1 hypothetical protein FB562_1754 [Homoserinimonas aerilata]